MSKNYRPELVDRVNNIRSGIEPQPFAALATVMPSLKTYAPKCRRILCRKVYPGDEHLIERMEKAKQKLDEVQTDVAQQAQA
jgi:hypothetical protein